MEHGIPPQRISFQPGNAAPGKIKSHGPQCFHTECDGNNILDKPIHLGDALLVQKIADGHLGTEGQPLAHHQGDEIGECHDPERADLEQGQKNSLAVIGKMLVNVQRNQAGHAHGAGADEIGVRRGQGNALLRGARRHQQGPPQRNESDQRNQKKQGRADARHAESPLSAGNAEKILLQVQQRSRSVAKAQRTENILKLYPGKKGGIRIIPDQHDENEKPHAKFHPARVPDGLGEPFFTENPDRSRQLPEDQQGKNLPEIAQGNLVFVNRVKPVQPQKPHQGAQRAHAERQFHDLETV